MTSAALGAILNHTDPMGLEVIIPRKITESSRARIHAGRIIREEA